MKFCMLFLILLAVGFVSPSLIHESFAPSCSSQPVRLLQISPMCGGGGGGCLAPCIWALNPYNGDEFPVSTFDPNLWQFNAPCSYSSANLNGFSGPFACSTNSPWQADSYISGPDDPSLQAMSFVGAYPNTFDGKGGVVVCRNLDVAGLAGCHADFKALSF